VNASIFFQAGNELIEVKLTRNRNRLPIPASQKCPSKAAYQRDRESKRLGTKVAGSLVAAIVSPQREIVEQQNG
jgi:hypothetical protein